MDYERVLRSVFILDKKENPTELTENFNLLKVSVLKPSSESLKQIYEEVLNYYDVYKTPPSIQSIQDIFTEQGRNDVKQILDLYKSDIPEYKILYTGNDFRRLLDALIEKQRLREYTQILEESKLISQKKTVVDLNGTKHTLKGINDSLRYAIIKSQDVLDVNNSGTRLSGDIREEHEEVWQEYVDRESDPQGAWGIPFGLSKIDDITMGLQNKQLCVISGFSSGGKSLFCMNYLWKACTWYGYNVVLITIEMDRKAVRRLFYCLHSNHPKFRDQGYAPLEYSKVKKGKLTPEQKDFYRIVVEDLNKGVGYGNLVRYGSLRIEQPSNSFSYSDMKMRTEYLDMKERVDLLCVDYLGLLNFSDRKNKGDHRVNFSELIKDTKALALTFRNGDGIPIITPHQLNREGWFLASQSDPEGQYTPKALSETNEILASSDLLLTVYLSEGYKEHNEMMVGGLKGRDDRVVPYHLVYCNQETRFIGNLDVNAEGPIIDHEELIRAIEF